MKRNLIMKKLAVICSAVTLTTLSSSGYAADLYGYLVVGKDGYSIQNVTPDPRNKLLDNWGSGTVGGAPAERGDRGYVKFNLNTLKPAADKQLSGTSCRDDNHWQPSWAPCSLYENAEDIFVKVGRRDGNYSNLWFDFSGFYRALKDALEKAGFADVTGVGKDAWVNRIADVSKALDQNNSAENQANDNLEAKICNSELEMNRFQPLIKYSPFKYTKKSITYPPLVGDLKVYLDQQQAERESFARATLEKFTQYFEPLKADAERSYPGLLAQQKAEALAREQAARAAQLEREREEKERERQEKVAAIEMKKQLAVEAKRVAAFRASIKVETETNCGPVIGVRGNLIQVSAPVAGYGNEHWVRRSELLPPGYGCWWHNGKYVGTERP